MYYNNLKNIINIFTNTINSNSSIIDTAISNDYKFNRYHIRKSEILNILSSFDSSYPQLSGKNILVRYNGNPYVTLNLILLSLRNNFNILFLPTKKFSLNDIFIKIFNDMCQNISLSINVSDSKIFESQERFDEIIYIGNVYNYNRFKENINIPILYNGFGTLEIYVDNEDDFPSELYELNKYIYENNIDIHYFHSTDLKKSVLFENTYKNRYCFIIYSKDLEKANKIKSLINAKFIYINPKKIDYKFEL